MKDLFEFQQYMKASLYNEIGLSANFNMKRERLTANEVEANTDNLYPLVDDMLNCRRLAIEKINEMFGLNIEVEFNSSWDYRLFNGEPIESEDLTDDGISDNIVDGNTDNTDTGVSNIDDNTEHTETTNDNIGADRTDIEDTERVEETEETENVETDENIDIDSEKQSENNEESETENETNNDTDDEDKEEK